MKTDSAFLKDRDASTKSNAIETPSNSLPKGSGAIRGIDEKFSVNAVNGTASFSVPLPFSPARGASPSLNLSYNSGAGNGIFGLGWNYDLPSIRRKTDKGLPTYLDALESDTYLFSGTEDLVPVFKKHDDGTFAKDENGDYVIAERTSTDGSHTIRFYKPRIEGLFARIERWTNIRSGTIKWRVQTGDNITTLLGWSSESVVADPKNPHKIFEWLPDFVFDDKGNCCQYHYKIENAEEIPDLLHNNNRVKNGDITYTNTYLAKVLYGNKTPYSKFGDPYPAESDFMFKTIFDYGEYDNEAPFAETKIWNYRSDSFSDYKAGFEIRTTRLCRRVLTWHHFRELPGGSALVKSLNFEYDQTPELDFTFLKSVTSFGYIKQENGTYTSKRLPATEFEYQKHEWNDQIKQVSLDSLLQAPAGLADQRYQFTDLYNEGLSGILTEQATGWYYKHNLGDGQFEPAQLVDPKPSFKGLGSKLQLMDLDADGGRQFVNFGGTEPGYYELDDNQEWLAYRYFEHLPNIDLGDPNTRILDLDGDGRPEILISEDHVFTWYQSEGRNGYSVARLTPKPFDEEAGPAIVFADEKQSIFLADMSGDGLTDIVRIRNGEVCYWPNTGFGSFGAKVAMDNPPLFDYPDSFNPTYLKLADIDGSGTADIIYLGKNKFSCWKNLSGNRFGTVPFEIESFPEIHTQAQISIIDLLGNGVACIVWSSPLSKDTQAPFKYIDLMGSKKPHVMTGYKNNLGKEVSFEYAPSTKFYIEDKLAGKPWLTQLQFPVHCVSRTQTVDKISGYRFVTSYRYHHGYYDHLEREFRGFGMVEQTDSEHFENCEKGTSSNIVDKELHQEPVVSKTWFHTGAFLGDDKILGQFEIDYWYREMRRLGYDALHHEVTLPDARIVAAPGLQDSITRHLSFGEQREALRACKGMSLRSEVFALDAPAENPSTDDIRKQLTPYSVSTHNCVIEILQPKGSNRHAVYICRESEAITYSYERNTNDPRIAHNLNVKLDEYGNILESASVVYPRLVDNTLLTDDIRSEQNRTIIIYTRSSFTNDLTGNDLYRLRLPSEVETFELKGIPKTGSYYSLNNFDQILDLSEDAAYQETNRQPAPGTSQKRLIEHVRTTYIKNTLDEPLPLHTLESLALPFESYQLAYTPALLNDIYGEKVNDALLETGRFTHCDDQNWWIRSGTTQFCTADETDADAQKRFYAPISYTDPYGAITKVKYYKNYFLFIDQTQDALGNRSSVELFNFYTLSPQRMRDINGNISEALMDELGLVKAIAVMGKGTEADDLDGIAGFTEEEEKDLILQFFNTPLTAEGTADSIALTATAKRLLQHATIRFVYDFDVYKNTGKPAVTASIVRQEHFKDNSESPVQLSFEYANGLGQVIMKKVQAEPGKAEKSIIDASGSYTVSEINSGALNPKQLRWIGNGRTILNNKGNAVKQYEPYFSVTNAFEDARELVESGVSPVMFYDAMGRLKKTKMPDGTLSRLEFDSWKQTVYDPNDTVLESEWYDGRINQLIDEQLIADGKDPIREKAAAEKAARHANTPGIMHLDTLGRPILSVEHNRDGEQDEFYLTTVSLDTEGNLRKVTDARGNDVVRYKYDMLGKMVFQDSMDAGKRWLFTNILGLPVRTWDERNREFQYFYDVAHRPSYSKVTGGDGSVTLDHIFDLIVYGESLLEEGRDNETDLQQRNVLGQPIRYFDTAGFIETPAFDFKGQPRSTTRKLLKDYKSVANWTEGDHAGELENESFTFTTQTDAMGRVTRQITPDRSILTPSYNEAGLLSAQKVIHAGSENEVVYINAISYNEKGQRERIQYGNDVVTRFSYDKETFRLKRLESKKRDNSLLQDLHYTYDPVGNITTIEDLSQAVTFFSNSRIEPKNEYTYDALYRLIEATGKENSESLIYGDCDNWNDKPFTHLLNTNDPFGVRNYTQQFQYDAVGNILQMKHTAAGGGWTRGYTYEQNNNRLVSTFVGGISNPRHYTRYRHHTKHGYLEELPHLESISWNFKEEVVRTIRQRCGDVDANTPMTTYYQYDGQGQRIRKITENETAGGTHASKMEERIYVSGYEVYKNHHGRLAGLERSTLSLMDEGHRFVMIETRNEIDDDTERQLVRYQLHNHLGSASLELDQRAQIISYEEYHPFGTTAFQAKNQAIRSVAKRYRYTGMERDEETGLEYHSARYYLPWLGRWLSSDPIGIEGGGNLFRYSNNNPINLLDRSGKKSIDDEGVALLRYYQSLVDQIPQDEFKDLTRASQGTRAHMALEFMARSGIDGKGLPPGTNLSRLASEVVIDMDTGLIVEVGMPPEKAGVLAKSGRNLRSVDGLLLKPGETVDHIVGRKASDVVDLALDYKTGAGKLSGVKDLEKVLGAPYIRVTQGGDVIANAIKKGAKISDFWSPLARSVPGKKTFPGGQATDVGEKALKKVGAKATTLTGKAIPIVGAFVTFETTEGSYVYRFAKAVAGEFGIGPVDLSLLFDAYESIESIEVGIPEPETTYTGRVEGGNIVGKPGRREYHSDEGGAFAVEW